MSLNALPVSEYLIRSELNNMLSIKRKKSKKKKIGTEEFKELNIEAASER